MMTTFDWQGTAVRFLDAWTSQDVDRVLACYADAELAYSDPNTRGAIRTKDEFRRYLAKLFAAWTMTWTAREVRPFGDGSGAAVLWRATFAKAGPPKDGSAATLPPIAIDGIDLVEVRGGLVTRNEVQFDRTKLVQLG